jgi:hypothetical protein
MLTPQLRKNAPHRKPLEPQPPLRNFSYGVGGDPAYDIAWRGVNKGGAVYV